MMLMVVTPELGTRTVHVTDYGEAATILKTLMIVTPDRTFGDLANNLLDQISRGVYHSHTLQSGPYSIAIA